MNNPTNPNKITAIIMIALAFSLIFIVGTAVQTYLNGQQGIRNGQIGTQNTAIIRDTVKFLEKETADTIKINNETNNILKHFDSLIIIQNESSATIKNNNIIFKSILDQLKQINNKTR